MHGHRFADAPFGPGFGAGFRRGRGRGHGGRGGETPPPVERAEVAGWFAGRLPDDWFTAPVELTIDRDEITVVGTLAEPAAGEGDQVAARTGRIARFREETRQQRMAIADAAQERYGRSVAWGAACGDEREVFTNVSVPVMTRLRQRERLVLDTLVDAGVARSRSEALVWAVRLVGQHTEDWLTELRDAMSSVEEVRGRGPSLG
jgi:4-aminobutyrate aminotransferase-like enzyme